MTVAGSGGGRSAGGERVSKQQVTLLPPLTAQTKNVAVSVQSFFIYYKMSFLQSFYLSNTVETPISSWDEAEVKKKIVG